MNICTLTHFIPIYVPKIEQCGKSWKMLEIRGMGSQMAECSQKYFIKPEQTVIVSKCEKDQSASANPTALSDPN